VKPSQEQLDYIQKQIEQDNYKKHLKQTRDDEIFKSKLKAQKFIENKKKEELDIKRSEKQIQIEQRKQQLMELEEKKKFIDQQLKYKAFQDAEVERERVSKQLDIKKILEEELQLLAKQRGTDALKEHQQRVFQQLNDTTKVLNRMKEVRHIENSRAHSNAKNFRD